MRICVPVPNHLFAIVSLALDNPKDKIYLVKTPHFNPGIENYRQGMWIRYNTIIHGAVPNISNEYLDTRYRLKKETASEFDLMFTMYEGNWSYDGAPIVPIDLPIPQIWNTFGWYIHQRTHSHLWNSKDELRTGYYPEYAIFRFENSVCKANNPKLKGKMIYLSADPDFYNNWNGNNRELLTIASHLFESDVHFNRIQPELAVVKTFPWTGRDFVQNEVESAIAERDRMRNVRAYVELTFRYSPAVFPKIMMTGCPVIVRDIPEQNYWIQDGVNGLVYRSPDDLRTKILKLLDDHSYAQQLSKRVRDRALELFDPAKHENQWDELKEMALKEYNKWKGKP